MDILIIDDEIRRMRATLELLQADGYAVEQIASPTKALETLQQDPNCCKVIILDIMMPPDGVFTIEETDYGLRTGILILERLHGNNNFETPVIVLTANAAAKDELADTTSMFLQKPTPYSTLVAAVEQCIDQEGLENG